MDYDPSVITYERLLDVFWSAHEPTHEAYSRQYASFVFAHDDAQERAAKASAAALEKKLGSRVRTGIRRLDDPTSQTQFWLAEDYHQKYALRADRALMADLKAVFTGSAAVPSFDAAFRDSTAAARLNAYVAGDATLAQLRKEIDSLGVSDASRKRLLSIVKESPSGLGCSVGDPGR